MPIRGDDEHNQLAFGQRFSEISRDPIQSGSAFASHPIEQDPPRLADGIDRFFEFGELAQGHGSARESQICRD